MEADYRNIQLVIGITGRIGSGKTVIAKALKDLQGYHYLRYSAVLAEWKQIDPTDKARLQDIGGDVMAGEGQRELNRLLISRIVPEVGCVVDGLRHPIDFECLKAAFGLRFTLVYVNTPPEVRFERLRSRFESYDEFIVADSRPVESNIDQLAQLASTTIPGTLSVAEVNVEAERLIRGLSVKSGP